MPKVNDKTLIKTQRFAVFITKKMQKRMQKHPEVNWSKVARNAFALKLKGN